MGHIHPTVFDALETKFAESTEYSATLVEQGEFGEGWPTAAIGMREARDTLYATETSLVVRDAIWAALIRYSRMCPQRWQLAAVWMMLPSMRVITRRLHRIWEADVEDIRSEVIIGFIESLGTVTPCRQKIAAFLWWATYRRARHTCALFAREKPNPEIDRIASNTSGADRSTAVSDQPIANNVVTLAPADRSNRPTGAEGERLGSLARRMGLDRQTRRPRSRTNRCAIRTTRSDQRPGEGRHSDRDWRDAG